jgi:hypothetical protein
LADQDQHTHAHNLIRLEREARDKHS